MEIFKLVLNFEVIVKKIYINHKICSKTLILFVCVNHNEEQYFGSKEKPCLAGMKHECEGYLRHETRSCDLKFVVYMKYECEGYLRHETQSCDLKFVVYLYTVIQCNVF
jgi:hypothetical protein